MDKTCILIVDDNPEIREIINVLLGGEGFEVSEAENGAQALTLIEQQDFDLIILDIMMPKMTGLEACMQIREFSNVPIIMLTAKGEDMDKLIGFEQGTDDYLTKPFNILELKARIRALLRRSTPAETKEECTRITCGDITLDTSERNAYKNGKAVELTAREFDLMKLLMKNPGHVYSRENLLDIIWGYEYQGAGSVKSWSGFLHSRSIL